MNESTTNDQPLFPGMEQEILAYWKKERVFERSIEERPESKGYAYYDGPPFATGLPHYGHLLQSALKDAVPRYWTMKGYRVPRRWGWDCHGLPIENLIEKQLNLGSKREIEAYGIAAFAAACRASVFGYEDEWEKYVDRIGRWVDFRRSYKTMDRDYIESVWWAFSELYKKKLVYEGVRVSLYCPRCATPLSNFEIAMGNSYVDHDDPAVYLKFPIVGEDRTYFVAWTTTPWSVPGVTGLAIRPDLTYVGAKIPSKGETLIVAERRLQDVLAEDADRAEIVGTWKGSELLGKHVEMPYRFVELSGDPYRVIAGDHVTDETGTGIVTTAPAFGEEDFQAAKQNDLPLAFTLDEEGRLIPEAGAFAGVKAKDADPLIIADLESRGLVHRAERITHSVPVCYRCSTLLLYKAQPAWFVDITTLKPSLLKTNEKIHWQPEHFQHGRFGKGLESAPDWNISRARYWGSPMPVWKCESCSEQTIISSIKELYAKAIPSTLPDKATFDPHRPVIDEIRIACACGGEQRRIPEVFDCWFESGSMPFASLHYPFEGKTWFDKNLPADFVGEAQDQTRGWFYTLHVLSTALFGKPAFKNIIATGLVLAEDGRKMSKSLKNYPDPWKVFETYGADALRYYLLSSPVMDAESLNFSERDLQSVVRGFLNLVWNVKVFYETYATEDVQLTKPRSAHLLDRWLFSRLAEVQRSVTENMDAYRLSSATRPLRGFVDDLSTWWLRRSRERLKSDNAFERMDALRTLREVLEELSKTMAPFTPFIADKIYLDIGGSKTSVHLERWSVFEEKFLDPRLTADMEWVRGVCSKAHELRASSAIPVRQALASLTVRMREAGEVERLAQQTDLLDLIRSETNVERIRVEPLTDLSGADPWTIDLDTTLTPELKRKGMYRELIRHVMSLRKRAGLQPADTIQVSLFCDGGGVRDLIEEKRAQALQDLRAHEIVFVDTPSGSALSSVDVTIGGSACWIGVERCSS